MRMAVRVESMRCAAETTIHRAAIFHEPPVRVARSIWNASGTAIDLRHKTHRYRADGRGTHHGQDHAARAFHVAAPALFEDGSGTTDSFPSPGGSEASESRSVH